MLCLQVLREWILADRDIETAAVALSLLTIPFVASRLLSRIAVMIDDSEPPVGVAEWCDPLEEEVVELPLLLPRWQMLKLERVAHQRGMTAAAMVRHVLRDFLTLGTAPSYRLPS
jgi:hypothetical protein